MGQSPQIYCSFHRRRSAWEILFQALYYALFKAVADKRQRFFAVSKPFLNKSVELRFLI